MEKDEKCDGSKTHKKKIKNLLLLCGKRLRRHDTTLTHLPYLTDVHNSAFSCRLFKCILFCLQSYKSLITFLLCPPFSFTTQVILLHFGTSDRKTLESNSVLVQHSPSLHHAAEPFENNEHRQNVTQECKTLSAAVNWSHPTRER